MLVHIDGRLRVVIQCKNLDNRFSQPSLLEELVKFVLYDYTERYILDDGITYVFWVPGGWTCYRRAVTSISADWSSGKRSHHSRSSPYLPHQSLEWVVDPETTPVFRRQAVVAQRLIDAIFDDLGGLTLTHCTHLLHDLTSLFLNGPGVSLRMDDLQHRRHISNLARLHCRPYVAVEMHHSALSPGFGVELSQVFDQPKHLSQTIS